jgi:type II protein arginine methyltransferase
MFTAPSSGPIANFSRVVNSSLDMMHYTQAIVRVSVDEDGWNTWNKIRMTSKHNPRLGVAIDVSFTLPETEEVNRWNAEPVKLVILSTKIFLKNSSGFPVLSKRHQQFVKLLMQVAIDLL